MVIWLRHDVYRYQTLSENTGWSHVEGHLDKKKMAFSQRLTKKLEEPYFCARIILTP